MVSPPIKQTRGLLIQGWHYLLLLLGFIVAVFVIMVYVDTYTHWNSYSSALFFVLLLLIIVTSLFVFLFINQWLLFIVIETSNIIVMLMIITFLLVLLLLSLSSRDVINVIYY